MSKMNKAIYIGIISPKPTLPYCGPGIRKSTKENGKLTLETE